MFYDPHAVAIKKLELMPDERIVEGFGRKDLKVVHNKAEVVELFRQPFYLVVFFQPFLRLLEVGDKEPCSQFLGGKRVYGLLGAYYATSPRLASRLGQPTVRRLSV